MAFYLQVFYKNNFSLPSIDPLMVVLPIHHAFIASSLALFSLLAYNFSLHLLILTILSSLTFKTILLF